jgi:hypothetical protein
VFWRDPSIGLVGAYGSYSHWNGVGGIVPLTGANISHFAAEGEYYWGRWTFGGLAGYETVRVSAPVVAGLPPFSIPNRFFDSIRASYYVTDNFKLSLGHIYTIGRNGLSLGAEYGFALGGGRMAALFAQGVIGEGGTNIVLGGLRIYFGQRDKALIDRNRQDDPDDYGGLGILGAGLDYVAQARLIGPIGPASSVAGTSSAVTIPTTTPGSTTPGAIVPGTSISF